MLAIRGNGNVQSTGSNIRTLIEKILRDFDCKLNEMVTVVTDRGSNMKAAFKNDKHIFCINHLLNNGVEKAIADVEEVSSITAACAKLVKYFKKSGMNSALNKILKSYTSTRWNTILFLLQSIQENCADISRILREKNETNRISYLNLGIMNEIVKILKPFEESSRMLEGENYPTLHCVYPQIHLIITICSSILTNDSEMLKKLKKKLLFQKHNVIAPNMNSFHKIALFLFPPANKLQNFQESEQIKILDKCKELIKLFENPENVDIPTEHVHTGKDAFSAFVQTSIVLTHEDEVSNKLQRYTTVTVLYYKDFNLLEWWETHKREYPLLYKLSCLVFATPAASERVFSKARHLLSERRF